MEGKIRRKGRAKVSQQECVACGCCAKVCPLSTIYIHKGIYAVVNESKCVKECPAAVIAIKEVAS
ncbi:MAG: 4Fe-4S ferredoxin [Oscillospiraceae bacterium]